MFHNVKLLKQTLVLSWSWLALAAVSPHILSELLLVSKWLICSFVQLS